MNIAVLASGNGSNFQALANACKRGAFKAGIKLLITDNKNAYARVRAKKLGVKDLFIDPKKYKTRQAFDKEITKTLKKEKIGLVLLAGYMRILTPYLVKAYKNKIINIHPAILPAFKGTHSIERAYKYGCKISPLP